MSLLPTFGFKGNILPIIDNTDKFYLMIDNDNNYKVLLNIVSHNINKFETINSKSSKILRFGNYNPNRQLKIFYLGRELFNFKYDEIPKEHLLSYGEYVFKKETSVENVSFHLKCVDGFELVANSNKPQNLYIRIVDNDKNEIIHEDYFLSSEPYIFRQKGFINYEISVYNIYGQKIYNYDLKTKNLQ